MNTRRSFLRKIGAVTAVGVVPKTADGNHEKRKAESDRLRYVENTELNPTLGLTKAAQTAGIDHYLMRMPELTGVVTQSIASGERPLDGYSLLLVHHLTGEILGLIAALRKLGCNDIVTVFVGYNSDVEKAYRPDLDDLPAEEIRFYVLNRDLTKPDAPYFVPSTFMKQPASDSIAAIDALNSTMNSKHLDFLAAMRALTVQVGLAQMARARHAGRRLLVIEDGGYVSPIINDAALRGITVAEMRTQYEAPTDGTTDAGLPPAMKDVVAEVILGSVEHTRNGYDFDMQTFLTFGKLAAPVFSIAVSYLKTQVESETVAATILNAVESVLYSHGVGLRNRRTFVFGSRGNIGRRLMIQLRSRLNDPDNTLIGCDLKVGRPDTRKELPEWQFRPSQSSAGGASEVATYAEVDAARTRNIDLILGVTGGPTPGHPVLQVDDVIEWLLNGQRPELYIASGSTKTDEFPELLAWTNTLLSSATMQNPVVETKIGGRRARVEKQNLVDLLSQRTFGSRYVFAIEQDDGSWRGRALLFLENLMPVNFLFYGEPTDIIDQVLAQLMSTGLALVRQAKSLPSARLYAVDFDPEASALVYGTRPPGQGSRIPLPLPAES